MEFIASLDNPGNLYYTSIAHQLKELSKIVIHVFQNESLNYS